MACIERNSALSSDLQDLRQQAHGTHCRDSVHHLIFNFDNSTLVICEDRSDHGILLPGDHDCFCPGRESPAGGSLCAVAMCEGDCSCYTGRPVPADIPDRTGQKQSEKCCALYCDQRSLCFTAATDQLLRQQSYSLGKDFLPHQLRQISPFADCSRKTSGRNRYAFTAAPLHHNPGG